MLQNWQEHSFFSDHSREVRKYPACLYQKLIWYFSVPLSFSYSYVPYSDSVYPFPKICTACSGKLSRFPDATVIYNCIFYQDSHLYIGIINHGRNWFYIHGSADRQPTFRSEKNVSSSYFKQILWQLFWHGHLVFLVSVWKMEKNLVRPLFVSCSSWKWLAGEKICYCNKMPIL